MLCETKSPWTPVAGGARERVWVGTVLARTTSDLVPLQQTVREALTAAGYLPAEQFGTRLALEEAVVNGLKHGHRGDRSKCVRVAYLITAAEMRLDVEDQGPGFRPQDVPDPLAPENLGCEGG